MKPKEHPGIHTGPPPVETPEAKGIYRERLQEEFKTWMEEKEKEVDKREI